MLALKMDQLTYLVLRPGKSVRLNVVFYLLHLCH